MHWFDTNRLSYVSSEVERFLLNGRGEADGMILGNGLEVHFAPHLSAAILAGVCSGDRITVYGVQPRGTAMLVAATIETARGTRIVDTGPPEKPQDESHVRAQSRKRRTMEVVGLVRRPLHGPKGDTRGALLDDGTIVHFSPQAAPRVLPLLTPAAWLAVRGDGLVTEFGTVIEVKEIGPSKDSLQPIEHPRAGHSLWHDGSNPLHAT
jgi:hypothetical protein